MDLTINARRDELDNVISLLKLVSEYTDSFGQVGATIEYNGKPSADTDRDTETSIPKEDIEQETTVKLEEEVKPEILDEPKKEAEIQYTKEDIISALQNLAAKKGKKESKELLGKYGCQKVSELKPEDYAGVIEEIERMI